MARILSQVMVWRHLVFVGVIVWFGYTYDLDPLGLWRSWPFSLGVYGRSALGVSISPQLPGLASRCKVLAWVLVHLAGAALSCGWFFWVLGGVSAPSQNFASFSPWAAPFLKLVGALATLPACFASGGAFCLMLPLLVSRFSTA